MIKFWFKVRINLLALNLSRILHSIFQHSKIKFLDEFLEYSFLHFFSFFHPSKSKIYILYIYTYLTETSLLGSRIVSCVWKVLKINLKFYVNSWFYSEAKQMSFLDWFTAWGELIKSTVPAAPDIGFILSSWKKVESTFK